MRVRTRMTLGAASVLVAGAAATFGLLHADVQGEPSAGTAASAAPTTVAQWKTRVVVAATHHAPTLASSAVTASAYDGRMTELPAEDFADATSADVVFAEGETRSWSVFVGPAVDPPQSDLCDRAPRYTVLNCTTAKGPATGDLIVQTVILAVKRNDIDAYETSLDARDVARRNPSRVRLERTVRLFRAGGSLSQVTETVYGTNDLSADSTFAVPLSALAALVTDPSLNVDLGG